ncbi:MAG: hypothetical protein AAF810_05365 [Cyanobacteria bacterium P01_D01_bin.36]
MKFDFYPLLEGEPGQEGSSGDPASVDGTVGQNGDTSDPEESLGEGGLKALQAERNKRREAERKARELQDKLSAYDPDYTSELESKVAAAEKAERDRKQKALEDKAEYDKLLQLKQEEFGTQVKTYETEISKAQAERDEFKSLAQKIAVDNAIDQGFLAASGDPSKLDWIRNNLSIRSQFEYDFDSRSVVVKDSKGDVIERDGSPMQPTVFFQDVLKAKAPDFFLSTNKASGGGAPPSQSSSKTGQSTVTDVSLNGIWAQVKAGRKT